MRLRTPPPSRSQAAVNLSVRANLINRLASHWMQADGELQVPAAAHWLGKNESLSCQVINTECNNKWINVRDRLWCGTAEYRVEVIPPLHGAAEETDAIVSSSSLLSRKTFSSSVAATFSPSASDTRCWILLFHPKLELQEVIISRREVCNDKHDTAPHGLTSLSPWPGEPMVTPWALQQWGGGPG